MRFKWEMLPLPSTQAEVGEVAQQVVLGGNVYDNVGAVLDAGDAAAADAVDGSAAAAGASLFLPKFLLGVALLGLAGSAATWAAWGVAQSRLISKGDIDKVDVGLTFEEFLEELLAPYDWPSTTRWELQDVHLADALLLYGKLALK